MVAQQMSCAFKMAIFTLLAEEVEGIQVLDVMDLLLLFTVGIIFHFLKRE